MEYDYHKTMAKIKEANLPHSLAERLAIGN